MPNDQGEEEVTVVEEIETAEDLPDANSIPTVQISMHALSGCSSFPATTFTPKLHFGAHTAITLVDSGSDISFINAKFAIKAQCSITPAPTIQILAANGKQMQSATGCLKCPYTLQGYQFNSDFRLLEVKGYDVILGLDWIYHHSPVGLDLKKRQLRTHYNNC